MMKLRACSWSWSGLALSAVLAASVVVFALSRAYGQPPAGQPPAGGPGGPGGGPFRMMAMMQPAAICAAGDFVYVVRGVTLYQFETKELKLVNKTKFEEEPNFPFPQGPAGGAGGGQAGGERRAP